MNESQNNMAMTEEELINLIEFNRSSSCAIDQTFADMWESILDEDRKEKRNEVNQ